MNAVRALGVVTLALAICGCRSQLYPAGSDGGAADLAPSTDLRAPQFYREQVIRACAIAAACTTVVESPFRLTVNSCIDEFSLGDNPVFGYGNTDSALIRARVLACAEAAGADCSAFRACYGGDDVQLSLCRENATCHGTVMTSFNPMVQGTFDCAALDLECTELATGAIRSCCTPRVCQQQYGVSCDSKTKGTMCLAGAIFDLDCSESGLVCNAGISGPPCRGEGKACGTSMTTTCDGAVATYCAGERLASLDCTTTILRTACNEGGFNPCKPAASQCSPTTRAACQSGRLTVCVDGTLTALDCRALGFSGCGPTAAGDNRCIP